MHYSGNGLLIYLSDLLAEALRDRLAATTVTVLSFAHLCRQARLASGLSDSASPILRYCWMSNVVLLTAMRSIAEHT